MWCNLRILVWLSVLLLLATLAAPLLGAQTPEPLEAFQVNSGATRADVPIGGQATLTLSYTDISRDSAGSVQPGGPGVLYHGVHIEATPVEAKPNWQVTTFPVSFSSTGGQSRDIQVQFQVANGASDPYYEADIEFTFTGFTGTKQNQTVHVVGYSPGLEAYTAQVSESYTLKPKQVVDVPVKIRNTALVPRVFDMKVVDNPCHMTALTTNGNAVRGRSLDTYTVTVQAPSKKLWYPYDSCLVTVQVSPEDNPNQVRTVIINVQIAGFYVNPLWIIHTVEVLLVLLLIILFVRRRKARIEEEILGKPQKPWTIPVEALYLKALKGKDERAWYVVRHHLMEEEYRSALLWYKSYKSATRGSRKKETMVVRQERGYQRWRRSWEKAIAKPLLEADRFEAKLQRKLDRKARVEHRKQMAKHRKLAGRLNATHAAQVERADKLWEKEARKAQKKGQPAPRRPSVPAPDLPDEPALQPIALEDHKWNRKAERFRARRVREQGDLEVKFEKADARRLHKLRRKILRVARKLDDPDFVAEHPLLQKA